MPEVREMIDAKGIMVTLSQRGPKSSHYIVHLGLMQCYMAVTSQQWSSGGGRREFTAGVGSSPPADSVIWAASVL